MPPKAFVETQKLIDAETRQQKRHCKTGGIERRQHEAAAPATARRSQTDDAAENWTNARRPARGKRDAERGRTKHPAWLVVGKETGVFVERGDFEQTDQLQAESDDHESANDAHPRIACDGSADESGGRAEQQKDD